MKTTHLESKPQEPSLIASSIVNFYRLWHGRLRLPGAGLILRKFSRYVKSLHRYPLKVDGVGTVIVDFRDHSGLTWLQHLIGDKVAAVDIERGLFGALRELMKDGDTFWDVGANAGTVSAFVVMNFPKSQILAFEPNPEIYRGLTELFSKIPRVETRQLALSDDDGFVTLSIPKGKSVGGSIEGIEHILKTSGLNVEDFDRVSVRKVRGDSMLGFDPPAVIKIDVEGHEAAAIRGLSDTIKKHRPIVLFEHLYLTDEAISKLIPDGYEIRSIDNETGLMSSGFERNIGHNSALIPDNRLLCGHSS